MKRLRNIFKFFDRENQNLEDLHIFQFHFIQVNVGKVYASQKTRSKDLEKNSNYVNYVRTLKRCYMSTKN